MIEIYLKSVNCLRYINNLSFTMTNEFVKFIIRGILRLVNVDIINQHGISGPKKFILSMFKKMNLSQIL